MLENIMVVVVIFIVFMIIYLLVNESYKKTYKKIIVAINQEKDVEKYFALTNSFLVRICMSKKEMLSLDILAYILSNDLEHLEKCLDELPKVKYDAINEVILYQNIICFYIKNDMVAKAQVLLEELEKKYMKSSSSSVNGLIREIRYIIYVDYLLDPSYIDDIKAYADSIEIPTSKGLFELRAAKLYAKLNDKKNLKVYLERAKNNLNETSYIEEINKLEQNV